MTSYTMASYNMNLTSASLEAMLEPTLGPMLMPILGPGVIGVMIVPRGPMGALWFIAAEMLA